MADVFISYSKADRAIAEALSRDLLAAGFDVWWDFALYAGDDFPDMIRAEIGKAKAVVVIWSETAVASRWVRGEANEAADLGTLIATHAPGFDPRKAPLNFREFHCEPVTNRERVFAALERKGAKRSTAPAAAQDPLADLRARVARGEAEAQLILGEAYYLGDYGVAKNEHEAVRLYKLAAEQGHAYAQTNLGACYQQGIGGLSRDEREAVRLYKLAAEQGIAAAQTDLGCCYQEGLGGLSKDEREAVRLYRLAAEQRYPRAQANLGIYYEQGMGGLSKNEREAVRLYKLAAEQGNATAQSNLGFCYEQGIGGLSKDEREAVRLYKLAAEQGHARAQYNLGVCYEEGIGGLPKDEREAVRLYKLAAAQGIGYAVEALKRLKVPL